MNNPKLITVLCIWDFITMWGFVKYPGVLRSHFWGHQCERSATAEWKEETAKYEPVKTNTQEEYKYPKGPGHWGAVTHGPWWVVRVSCMTVSIRLESSKQESIRIETSTRMREPLLESLYGNSRLLVPALRGCQPCPVEAQKRENKTPHPLNRCN